jgi:hypothetical protein
MNNKQKSKLSDKEFWENEIKEAEEEIKNQQNKIELSIRKFKELE